jgi:hypothetical protein
MFKYLSVGLVLLVVLLSVLVIGSRRAMAQKDALIARLTAQVEELQSREQPVQAPSGGLSNAERSELLRLRGEVTRLKAESAESKVPRSTAAPMQQPEPPAAIPAAIPLAGDRLFQSRTNTPITAHDEAVRQGLNEKESDLQAWWKAFKTYADQHNGDLPLDFAEAAAFLPADFQNSIDVSNFTRPTPSGTRTNLKNLENPGRTVLFKERVPLTLSDGLVCNVYFFADGSVQVFQE